MSKARFSVLCASTALVGLVLATPASAQEAEAPPQTTPQPQAPKDTPVESQEVTEGVAQAPQQDEGVFGGDIVVTAQKREERLQDVGISVTALSGEALETLNADAPAIFLYAPANVAAVRRTFSGVPINPYSWLSELPERRPAQPEVRTASAAVRASP